MGPARRARGRRADQGPHREGRQPRHGARRGVAARLAPGALRDQARGRRQLQAHGRVRLPARARRGRAPRRRQPQPLRHRATASCCAQAHGVEAVVEFEMLEGMANHQARAVQARAGGLLLYAPVVAAEDFHSAIAYLVRRLDENTAPENFLRHVFDLEPDSTDWHRRARPFPGRVRRHGRAVRHAPPHPGPGAEAPALAGAVARRAVRQRAGYRLVPRRQPRVDRGRRRALAERAPEAMPLEIGGRVPRGTREARGRDPSRPRRGGVSLRARRPRRGGSRADRRAGPPSGLAIRRRRAPCLLEAGADELARPRGDLIGAMILDGAKTVPEADAEVSEAVDFARYYADAARDPTRWRTVASSRSAWWSWHRPGTFRFRSRPAACWQRCGRQCRRLEAGAGSGPGRMAAGERSGTPGSRATHCIGSRAPTATWVARSSPIRASPP